MASESNHMAYLLGALIAVGIAYFFFNPSGGQSKAVSVLAANANANKLSAPVSDAIMHSSEYRKFKLTAKVQLSPNTARYRFELPSSES
ncbi:hypothetical protein LPJ66_010328, partial [Kickxella alabastrina]